MPEGAPSGQRRAPPPRVPLAQLPTPLEPADRLGRELGLGPGRLWIKRDDLTGLGTGGNKARKAELLVAAALADGADTLVSGGGPQSNHARTVAAAAARIGLRSVLVFAGDPPPHVEGNQVLDVLFGAERRFLGPVPLADLDVALERIAAELRAEGRRPYVIPFGGSSALGASAYVTAAEEILGQMREAAGHEDVIVVTACGSGGTQAGLAARLGYDRVMGVDVGALPDPGAVVMRLAVEVAELVGLPAPSGEPWIERGQVGVAYAAPTDACREAIRLAARTEGVLLDPVYSGKAMAGLIAACRAADPRLGDARAIVFLASGGVPALFVSRYEDWLTA